MSLSANCFEAVGKGLPVEACAFALVLGDGRGKRDRAILRIDPLPFERADLATPLAGENEQLQNFSSRVAARTGLKDDRLHFVVRKQPLVRNCLQFIRGVAREQASPDFPAEKCLDRGIDMRTFRKG